MKELLKNWKTLGLGGAIGAALVGAVVGTIKVVKTVKDKNVIDEIDSYEEFSSDDNNSSEE